jgi:ATP-dependent protease ClpP protease subunit
MNPIPGLSEVLADADRLTRRPWPVSARGDGRVVIRAAVDDVADVYLYAGIGGFYGVTAEQFVAGVRAVNGAPLRVHINSPGGDAFDGLAMYNVLRSYPAPVETIVEGLAASAASVVAMAGNPARMARASFLMVHEPWGAVMGTADDFVDMAAVLERMSGVLADVYADKTGASRKRVREWMHAETWFTPDEAETAKLIDGIFDPPTDNAVAAAHRFDLSAYRNTPASLRVASGPPAEDRDAALAAQRAWIRERQAALSGLAA